MSSKRCIGLLTGAIGFLFVKVIREVFQVLLFLEFLSLFGFMDDFFPVSEEEELRSEGDHKEYRRNNSAAPEACDSFAVLEGHDSGERKHNQPVANENCDRAINLLPKTLQRACRDELELDQKQVDQENVPRVLENLNDGRVRRVQGEELLPVAVQAKRDD